MPGLFHRFFGDRRGTSFEGIALSVSIVAVAFVASADMLDYMMKRHSSEAGRATVASTAAKDLDMTPTASVRTLVTRSVLDPCTGQSR